MITALVFDFDGLMVDTESPAYDSWEEVYQSYGCTLPIPVWAAVLGGSGHEFDACAYLAELSGQPIDPEPVKARRWQRKLELVAHQPLLPGILDALQFAHEHHFRLAVASSSPQSWVFPQLERLGVTACFDTIVTGDQVAQIKPDPALYQLAVQRLSVQPSETLAIEDSLNGLRSAKAAGVYCVIVPNKFTQHLDFQAADLQLPSFDTLRLPDILTRIEQHQHVASITR